MGRPADHVLLAMTATTSQNALHRLADKNIVTRIDRGNYRFEDEAFADWARHRE